MTVLSLRSPFRIAGLASLAFASLVAACGDDETGTSGGGGSGGAGTSSTATGPSSTAAGPTATTAASGSTGGGAPDTSGTSGGGAGDGGAGDGGAGGSGGAGTGGASSVGSGGSGSGGGGGAPDLQPGFSVIDLAMPIDLTSDGRRALLQDPGSIEADVYFYDVATEELTFATSLGDALADFATGLSDDGVVSALHDVPVQAGTWSEGADWVDLESPFAEGCDINVGGAWDVSRDGDVTVGFFWEACSPQAFRFTRTDDGGELTMLDRLGSTFDGEGEPVNRATVVSDDGSVAAGFAMNGALDRSAAVWTADGSGFLLDEAQQDAPSEVLSISSDGSVVGGTLGFDAFRWTEADGMVVLPRLDAALPSDPMFVNAIAADGDLLFGASGDAFSGIPIAFVWSDADGIRSLEDVVLAAGIELPEGTILNNVLAASEDGTVLLGVAMDADFVSESFVLRLPPGAFDGG